MDQNWAEQYFLNQPAVVAEDLEVKMFGAQVGCAPWPFPDQLKVDYSNVFYQTIFEIIAASGIPKSSLTFTSPVEALEVNRRGGPRTTGWFGISYREPGRSFGLTVDDGVFQIRSDDIRLTNLVHLAGSIFSRITDAWVSEGLAAPVHLKDRAHTVDYTFEFSLRLGKHKVQSRQVKNYELLAEALSVDRQPAPRAPKAVADALPTMGIERYLRMDYVQHALKTIDGQVFNVGIKLEAPLNEGNSILDVTTFLRAEEGFGFDLVGALRWDTVFVSYLREIVLKRFLENLLCSTAYTNR